jgi:hypothetical protein
MPVRTELFLAALVMGLALGASPAPAQTTAPSSTLDPSATAPRPGQRPDLNEEQRTAIFRAVRDDKTKTARADVAAQVGAEVPPSAELYGLPYDAVATAPVAKMFRFVVVDGKVVLVDPTTMRVVEVIDR